MASKENSNMQRYAVLTMDVEEPLVTMDGLGEFISLMNKHNIRATLFAVSDLVKQNPAVQEELKNAIKQGHEIACHSKTHIRPLLMTMQEFTEELKQAKEDLSSILNCDITGYRAPYFGIDNERYGIVREKGFSYSSSKMDVPMHPLYGHVDLTDFEETCVQGVFAKDGFLEFPLCTVQVLGRSISVSGGGWFRFLPWRAFMKPLIKKSLRKRQYYVYYSHPYELSEHKVPKVSEGSLLSRLTMSIRLNARRKIAAKRIKSLIELLKAEDYTFCTFSELQKVVVE